MALLLNQPPEGRRALGGGAAECRPRLVSYNCSVSCSSFFPSPPAIFPLPLLGSAQSASCLMGLLLTRPCTHNPGYPPHPPGPEPPGGALEAQHSLRHFSGYILNSLHFPVAVVDYLLGGPGGNWQQRGLCACTYCPQVIWECYREGWHQDTTQPSHGYCPLFVLEVFPVAQPSDSQGGSGPKGTFGTVWNHFCYHWCSSSYNTEWAGSGRRQRQG